MFLKHLGLSIFASMLSLAAAAAPENASFAGDSFERARKALEMPLAAIQAGPSDVGAYRCAYEGPVIQYNGATTLQLVNCLMEAPKDASRLVITSAGGEVNHAIFAAYVVKVRELDVEVVGMCASSCSNYILPSAKRAYLDKFSAILVHGGGTPPDREEMAASIRRAGYTEDSPAFEQIVSDNLKRSELTYRLHKNFVRDFNIGERLYDLEDIWSARRAMGQQNTSGMIRVDPASLQECLPDVEIIAEAPNLEGLQKLLPKYNLGSFADVRGAGSSCSG